MKGYPKWFTPFFISIFIFTLFSTGLLLVPTTLELRFQYIIPWRLAGDDRILIVALHALFGFLVVGLMGSLWSIHMRQEWRRKKNRLSGAILFGSLVFLMLTGVCIYYLANETFIMLATASHLFIGCIVYLIYLWHSIFFNKSIK